MEPVVYAFDINKDTFPGLTAINLGSVMNFIIPMIMIVAALGFLAMLLLGAFQWMTAGDKPDNISKAQKTMVFAFLGLILVIFSYTFVRIIVTILGVNKNVPL
jgi:hypothetical protein